MSSLSGSGALRRGPNGYFETVMPKTEPWTPACPLDTNDKQLLDCARRGDAAGLTECLERGGNPNAHNDTMEQNALMIVLKAGLLDCVKIMAAHPRMNLRAADRRGNEAWLLAASSLAPDCMEELARACAAREKTDPLMVGWAGVTSPEDSDALILAVSAGCAQSAEVARDYGADPRGAGRDGVTALMAAAMSGDSALLDVVLPGSDPLAKDKQGNDALMTAASNGFAKAVMALLPLSEPREVNLRGENALTLACTRGHVDCVHALASVMADSGVDVVRDALTRCMRGDYAACMVAVVESRRVGTQPGAQLLIWAQLWGRAEAFGSEACMAEAGQRAQSLAQSLDLDAALRAHATLGVSQPPRL